MWLFCQQKALVCSYLLAENHYLFETFVCFVRHSTRVQTQYLMGHPVTSTVHLTLAFILGCEQEDQETQVH